MTWTLPAYEAIADLLVRRTGLVFGPTRRDSAETGIRRAMGRAGVREPDRYRERLETDAAVLDDLVVELTVGETYFFREPAQFRFLRREVLPDLWRRHGPTAVVRVWSAACASGEEAYSLAIVLEEEGAGRAFAPAGHRHFAGRARPGAAGGVRRVVAARRRGGRGRPVLATGGRPLRARRPHSPPRPLRVPQPGRWTSIRRWRRTSGGCTSSFAATC